MGTKTLPEQQHTVAWRARSRGWYLMSTDRILEKQPIIADLLRLSPRNEKSVKVMSVLHGGGIGIFGDG